ncbi:aspartate carbamoyltransferase [Methanolapillus ohkumae]|uniref:Aspartate carbamoyltransferase n=1 Tax=Methanolapillus ohkumae TaxID=3028298 RepID=A0AA96ZWL7_9EURY|nr:Aspartate carbamoyltransferase catalytic subunit [Methanosarcinaceae archaeon Am2]
MQPLHHIISTREYSREMLDEILETAEKLEPIARGERTSKILDGKVLALLFFEPSTRTRMSFETAMIRLGGQIINMGSVEASSIAKGESLADTIRVVSRYADAVVLRHPHEGAALMASEFSSSPIINGGDGAGHHPTQTLLDLYTIKRESSLDHLNIALAGDLKYGRTVHSLCYALSRYGAKINLVSPPELELPKRMIDDLKNRNIKIHVTHAMEDVIEEVDVLYMTRIQKERFPDPAEFNRVSNSMRITEELIRNCKPNLKIMHPLPRVNEIAPGVDKTPHAAYFKQAFYGIPVRMAILCKVLGVDI